MSQHADEHPIVGKDISWKEFAEHNESGLLRVVHFTPFASLEGKKVKAPSLTMPYGILTVECLELKSSFQVLLSHKVDFANVCNAHEWCGNSGARERVLLARAAVFKVCGLGDFEDMYSRLWRTREVEVIVGDYSSQRQGVRKWVTKLSGAMMPKLFVWVCPKRFLERAVHNDWGGIGGEACFYFMEPLARWEPPA